MASITLKDAVDLLIDQRTRERIEQQAHNTLFIFLYDSFAAPLFTLLQ